MSSYGNGFRFSHSEREQKDKKPIAILKRAECVYDYNFTRRPIVEISKQTSNRVLSSLKSLNTLSFVRSLTLRVWFSIVRVCFAHSRR